ncbi:MAG: hypothetical protein DME53_05960 [Verrucomicrobia bacterium]|nr:MAG: hypothetical protein DME53_05960 [Verrucomicrobiota bacterium]
MPQLARHLATCVLHHQINVRLFIDVVEKRKRRRKYENPNCGNGAKQQNQLSLISHCDSDRSY